jgi:hypothetical protein
MASTKGNPAGGVCGADGIGGGFVSIRAAETTNTSKSPSDQNQESCSARVLAARTTFERAVAGYDEAFERRLAEALIETIGLSSIVTDAAIMSLRSAETASAKVIRRKVAKARAEGTFDLLGAAKGGQA